jgi:hypothetical protein
LQITDIFAECSIDYDPKSQVIKDFFATVQNKFHYAITGQTAAEIINAKVNKSERNQTFLSLVRSVFVVQLTPDFQRAISLKKVYLGILVSLLSQMALSLIKELPVEVVMRYLFTYLHKNIKCYKESSDLYKDNKLLQNKIEYISRKSKFLAK